MQNSDCPGLSKIDNLFWKKLRRMNNDNIPIGFGWSMSSKYVFIYVPKKHSVRIPKVFKGRLIVFN